MSNQPQVVNLDVTGLTPHLPPFPAAMAVRQTAHGIQFMIINVDKQEVVAHATLTGPGTAELINQALEVLVNG